VDIDSFLIELVLNLVLLILQKVLQRKKCTSNSTLGATKSSMFT